MYGLNNGGFMKLFFCFFTLILNTNYAFADNDPITELTDYHTDFYNNIKDVNIDADKLYEYYNVPLATGGIDIEDISDLNNMMNIDTVVTNLANMEKIIRDGFEKHKAAEEKLNEYTADSDVKAALEAYLAYYKESLALLNAKNAAQRKKIYTDQPDPAITDMEQRVNQFKETFNRKKALLVDAKLAEFNRVMPGMQRDLKVSKPDISNVAPTAPCDKEKPECNKDMKNHIARMLMGKSPAVPWMVKIKSAKSCPFDRVAKALKGAIGMGAIACDNYIGKNGMYGAGGINRRSLTCASFFNTFGNEQTDPLMARHINKLNGEIDVNLAMATSGSGLPASIPSGGVAPSNVFAGGASGGGRGSSVTPSSISSNNDGSTRYNANMATSSFYNPASNTYNNMASGAKSFVQSNTGSVSSISAFNNNLENAIMSYNTASYKTYKQNAEWGTSTLSNTAKLSSGSQQVNNLKNEYQAQQNFINGLTTQLPLIHDRINKLKFIANYGSDTASDNAIKEILALQHSANMLNIQAKDTSTRMGIMRSILGPRALIDNYQYGFNSVYMYAQNKGAVSGKAIKLEELETPAKLKDGWQDILKKYIQDMNKKANEAKKELNESKKRIRKLISKKLPIIQLDKIPQPGDLNDEFINMRSLKETTEKNMLAINNAMAYHASRKKAYKPGQYEGYEDEYNTMTKSMSGMLSSINYAEEPVSQANSLVKQIYREVPRTEALKAVAKELVEKGL